MEPDAKSHRRISWTRGDSRPRSSPGAAAVARTFLLLEAHLDSLTTRSSRYQRPRRRYEDLYLATAVCRVQRDWLLSTTDSEWTVPGLRACLLAATKRELAHQPSELARSRRRLSRHARRMAEARARERFETIVTQVAAGLFRADQMSPPESAPGNPDVSAYAIYRRLRALMLAATQAAPTPAGRRLPAGLKRLPGVLGVPAALRRERKPLARLRFGLARGRPQTTRTATALGAAVFVALAVLTALIALPSDRHSGDEGGPHSKESGARRGVATVQEAPSPRTTALETLAAVDGRQAHAYPAKGLGPGRGIETLVVALTVWKTPALAHDKDCSDFTNQKRSQRWFNKHHPHRDPSELDRDHDGKACEGRPCPCSHSRPRGDRHGPAREAGAREQAAGDVAAGTSPSESAAAGTTGTVPVTIAALPFPAPAPPPALMPSAPVTQPVRTVDQVAATAGVETDLSEATGGLTSGLDEAVGGASDTLDGATGGLFGN